MGDDAVKVPSEGAIRRAARMAFALISVVTGPWTRANGLQWLLLILLILVILWTGYQSFSVPTGSMEPTLHGDPRFLRGDRIGVNKLIYGPRVPFMNKRIFHLCEPRRWDIVVFKAIEKDAAHPILIKRVVGLPGERIHIADGKIQVNGAPVEPPEALRPVPHYTTELGLSKHEVERYLLTMAEKEIRSPLLNPEHEGVQALNADLTRLHERLEGMDPGAMTPDEIDALFKDFNPVSLEVGRELCAMEQTLQYPLRYGILAEDQYSVVPPNCYLVCGDNSGESVDGRYFGWVPNGNILGRAFCIWWPISHWRDFTGFSKTWWGMAFLYGLPALFAGHEIYRGVKGKRGKREKGTGRNGETEKERCV